MSTHQTPVPSKVSYPSRIYTPNTQHLFRIGFGNGKHEGEFDVEANNRTQAASIVRKLGYMVRDVNMVG